MKKHEGAVWSVAFSPDGTKMVSGSSDTTLRLWNLEGEEIGNPMKKHEGAVWSVAFSPDGKQILSSSADHTIRRWIGGNLKDWLEVILERHKADLSHEARTFIQDFEKTTS